MLDASAGFRTAGTFLFVLMVIGTLSTSTLYAGHEANIVGDGQNSDWIKSVIRLHPHDSNGAQSPDAMIDKGNADFRDEGKGEVGTHISIGGPTLARVPDALLGNSLCGAAATRCYYLYYSHHRGRYIRMSHAQDLKGPWTAYLGVDSDGNPRGVLKRSDVSSVCDDHIASPNVQVRPLLPAHQRFVMYFHCQNNTPNADQRTWVATSENGYDFSLNAPGVGDSGNPALYIVDGIGHAYASVAQIFPGNSLDGKWVHISRRANNNAPINMTDGNGLGSDAWTERGCNAGIPRCSNNGENQFKDPTSESQIHHVGITARGRYLYVFFHRKEYSNDKPMHIRVARIDMNNPDWSTWGNTWDNSSASYPVLMPETDIEQGTVAGECQLEGKGGAVEESGGGCDVRDPFIFNDRDGRSYLVYSFGWEYGANIAEIRWSDCGDPDIGDQPGCLNDPPTANDDSL